MQHPPDGTGDPEADLLVQAGREYVERGLDELLAAGRDEPQPPDAETTP